MANKIQIRRDTTANWTASNPILSQGELGLDTTLQKVKIGDGISNWSTLLFYFDVPSTLVNGSHTVELNSTGGVNFPTLSVDIHNGGIQSAQVLKFNKASQQVIITGPSPAAGNSAERIIIQGQRATGNGEGGDVYLWGGDSDINGGDIKIYAGDADSDVIGTNGGYVNIDAGNGFTYGGHLTLSAGVARGGADSYGGNVSITAGYAYNGTPGNIQLTTYAQSDSANLAWTFTNDGKLQLPVGGDIVNNAGNPITDIYKFEGGTIGTKNNVPTSNGWGGYNMYLDPGGESWASIFIPSVANQDSGNALQITNKGAATSIVQVTGWGGVQLVTNTGLDEKVFEFGDNGTLTFPDMVSNISALDPAQSGGITGVALTGKNRAFIGIINDEFNYNWDFRASGAGSSNSTVDPTIQFPGGGWLKEDMSALATGGFDIPVQLGSQGAFTLTVKNNNTFPDPASTYNWVFGTDGRTTLPNGAVPAHSYGATGDKEGMVVFSDNYIYYCKQDYVGNSVNVTTLASSGSFVYVSSTDYAGDLVADFTANSTGWTYAGVSIIGVAVDNTFGPGYALEAATSFGAINGNDYALVSPITPPDIWKRVSWSGDIW